MNDATEPNIALWGHNKLDLDGCFDGAADILLFCDKQSIGEAQLASFSPLKVLASPTTNDDHIDLSYCRKRGIEVITLKGDTEFLYTITPTAEHTWGLIHAVHRRIPTASKQAEPWNRWHHGAQKMLSKSTLLVVGRGRVGHFVYETGRTLCKKVLHYSADPKRASRQSLHHLAQQADILAICISWHPNNRNFINDWIIEALPNGAIIVNTSHGDTLDLDVTIDHLESGHLWGAALDVLPGELEVEWPPQVRRAFAYAQTHDNLIITPHIAGSTEDAWKATQGRVLQRAIEKWRAM